ncbi:hypothetical protein DFP73DRAFT_533384, partial [Morchella snyderi]
PRMLLLAPVQCYPLQPQEACLRLFTVVGGTQVASGTCYRPRKTHVFSFCTQGPRLLVLAPVTVLSPRPLLLAPVQCYPLQPQEAFVRLFTVVGGTQVASGTCYRPRKTHVFSFCTQGPRLLVLAPVTVLSPRPLLLAPVQCYPFQPQEALVLLFTVARGTQAAVTGTCYYTCILFLFPRPQVADTGTCYRPQPQAAVPGACSLLPLSTPGSSCAPVHCCEGDPGRCYWHLSVTVLLIFLSLVSVSFCSAFRSRIINFILYVPRSL